MSTVKLSTFAIYTTSGKLGTDDFKVKTLYGASGAHVNANNGIELTAESVPFHSEKFKESAPKPGYGMLMLYGIRDSLEEMHYWRTKARELNAKFASAEFEFDIGLLETGLSDRQDLRSMEGKSKFLNLRRMKSSFQSDILYKFSQYAAEEGGDINEDMNRISQIATRPDFFDKLLKTDRDLSKLDVLVIPIADDPEIPGRMRQVAYVKPGAEVVSVVQGSDDANIVLPSWMTSRSIAGKLIKQPALA